MKKARHLIVLMVLAIFVCGSAHAEFRFGVKAGVNVNELRFNETAFDAANRAGFTLGVMTEFTVPVVGIGMDLSLMYTRMNSVLDKYEGAEIANASLGKNFLEVPVNFKYKVNIPMVASVFRPMIFTGPNFAFKFNGGKRFDALKTKTFQVGWNLGVGVELVKHLQIAAGYTWGINNLAKKIVNSSMIGDVKVRNNYWTITAAYLF